MTLDQKSIICHIAKSGKFVLSKSYGPSNTVLWRLNGGRRNMVHKGNTLLYSSYKLGKFLHEVCSICQIWLKFQAKIKATVWGVTYVFVSFTSTKHTVHCRLGFVGERLLSTVQTIVQFLQIKSAADCLIPTYSNSHLGGFILLTWTGWKIWLWDHSGHRLTYLPIGPIF